MTGLFARNDGPIASLEPVERFLYWCGERHKIHERRAAGLPKPWTTDPILRRYYFTNVYRELDKTTAWFRRTVRDPLRATPAVVFATVCFRWFNLIETGEILSADGFLTQWDEVAVIATLSERRANGFPIFTGAFMVNSPAGRPKLEAICERISNVWHDLERLVASASCWKTMRDAHKDLLRYPGLGGFMAYELVCDLRHTVWLEHATDIMTWSNPGPGAVRGLYRVLGREISNKSNATSPPVPPEWADETLRLRALLEASYPSMPTFEAREVEQSLCEFDKYDRLLFGDGRSKRVYDGWSG